MKIDGSVLCDLCLERCSVTEKRLFRKEQEVTLKTYNTMIEHNEDGSTKDVHFCWECMQLMRGAAAKILLKNMEKRQGK